MSEIKSGETVRMALQQIDAENRIIMDLDVKWYGFTNAEANTMINDIVSAVQGLTVGYAKMKAERDK